MITVCPKCRETSIVIQIDNHTPFRCGICQEEIAGKPARISVVIETCHDIAVLVPEGEGSLGAESLGFDLQTSDIREYGDLTNVEIEHTTFDRWLEEGEY